VEKPWRKYARAIHRDVGYVIIALTLAYGISGLAVNHVDAWNPNYKFAQRNVDIGPVPSGSPDETARLVATKAGLDASAIRGHVFDTATDFRVFFPDGQELRVDLATGRGTAKTVTTRAVLFQVNALHLNNLKGWWTYVADLFAIAMILMALTGAVMLKGQLGISGRGKWFIAGGLAIPVAGVLYMYS
jgi:hypothetical protein